jgi:hypothetical protein
MDRTLALTKLASESIPEHRKNFGGDRECDLAWRFRTDVETNRPMQPAEVDWRLRSAFDRYFRQEPLGAAPRPRQPM